MIALTPAAARAQTSPTDQRPRGSDGLDRTAWHLSSDTRFVAYDVQASGGRVVWQRRRLYQRAGFDFVVRLGDLEEAARRGRAEYELHVRVDLRLDQGFGEVCQPSSGECLAELEQDERLEFQVLARSGRLDLPTAQIELRGPEFGVRLGRQLVADAVGFMRVDGLSTRYEPLDWLAFEAYGGLQTQEGWLGGSAGLTEIGPIRFDLSEDVLPERAAYVSPTTPYGVAGVGAVVGRLEVLRARVAFRELRDGSALAARRVAFGVSSSPVSRLRLEGSAVLDGTDATPLDALGSARWREDRWDVHARVSHQRPRFDLGSIWAYFQTVPVTRVELGAGWRPNERWSARAGLQLRTSDPVVDETLEDAVGVERDMGGEVSVALRELRYQLGARAFLYLGDLDPVGALLLDARGRLGPVDLYGRASLWYHDPGDTVAVSSRQGFSLAGALGAAVALGDISALRAELELTHGPEVGPRWHGLAFLDLGVMR